jgi:hypothetical protein
VLTAIRTRAQLSGRRTTGQYQSNRQPRWRLPQDDPQYGGEAHSKVIELRLLGMVLEFDNAPAVDEATSAILAPYIGHLPRGGTYRDVLTLERLDYNHFIGEAQRHGLSDFHIGHDDPTLHPRHVPDNISWRSLRSNLIQGDMTLTEARASIVRLVARYFNLGELTINPDEVV